MNVNIIEFNRHQGGQGMDDFTYEYLRKVTETGGNLDVSTSPSLSLPDKQPKSTSKGKSMGKMKSSSKDKPKRRRNLSGYNFYMKYHRTVTVSPGMTLDILDNSLTHEEKLKHVLQVLERDPYRLDNGQKRRHRKSHGAIGFKELTIQVASSWRSLDMSAKSVFEDIARQAKHQKHEKDSSTDSRRPSFEVQSATQGANVHAVLEEAFHTTTTTTTSMPNLVHFPSNGSTPSVSTTGTSTGVIAAAPSSSLLQQPIMVGNSSASSVMNPSALANAAVGPYTCDDIFEPAPLTVTSQVPVDLVDGGNHPFSMPGFAPCQEGFPNNNNNNNNNNELASFLSRLDWSQL